MNEPRNGAESERRLLPPRLSKLTTSAVRVGWALGNNSGSWLASSLKQYRYHTTVVVGTIAANLRRALQFRNMDLPTAGVAMMRAMPQWGCHRAEALKNGPLAWLPWEEQGGLRSPPDPSATANAPKAPLRQVKRIVAQHDMARAHVPDASTLPLF